jgi:hypothetical protein
MPAQFSTTLIPPNAPALEETLYIGCIRHIGLDGDGPAATLISATTSSVSAELAKFTTTTKPSCASLVATARPIRREAPVTMTLGR